ncbi:MAG: phage head closure protein [Parvibaculaceae bacterium]|nr:phage head closure protein [Parvibaculaceae bacterium]
MSGRIGPLRERVTIEQASMVFDDAGGHTLSWTPIATVWAQVENRSGSEVVVGERIESRGTRRVRIRRRTNIGPGMRLVWGSKVLDIRAVTDSASGAGYIWLICDEVSYGA